MDRDTLLSLIDAIAVERTRLRTALGFLRLVASNNIVQDAAQMLTRPDVQEALGVIDAWIAAAHTATDAVHDVLPAQAALEIPSQVDTTLDRLERDTRVTEANLDEWARTPPEEGAARVLLRMKWLQQWLRAHAQWAALDAPYKRWVSRLAANTCGFCRALHGAVVPAGASFAAEARRAGYRRVYGGLYAPPLHPHCQCRLEPVTQAEFLELSAAA